MAFVLLVSLPAQAQQICVPEVEPNDQIDQAATLTGALCFEGNIESNAQDRFVWSIPQAEGAHGWTIGYEGGYATARVVVQAVTPADGATPRTEGAELLRLDVPQGDYGAQSPEFLLQPGIYLLDVLSSGASPYRVRIAPRAPVATEAEPNDTPDLANVLEKDTTLSGSLQNDPDVFAFTVTEAEARHHWTLQVNGPLGGYLSTELLNQKGESLFRFGQTMTKAMDVADLGFAAGTYYLTLSPTSDAENPYTLRLFASGPRLPSREDEPNDTPATAFPLIFGHKVIGTLGRDGDTDSYRFDVTAAMQGKLIDVAIKSASYRSLCLTDGTTTELQCRNAASPTLKGLSLPVGHYNATVWGTAYPEEPYEIALRISGRAQPNTETEPNDKLSFATPLLKGHRDAGTAFAR